MHRETSTVHRSCYAKVYLLCSCQRCRLALGLTPSNNTLLQYVTIRVSPRNCSIGSRCHNPVHRFRTSETSSSIKSKEVTLFVPLAVAVDLAAYVRIQAIWTEKPVSACKICSHKTQFLSLQVCHAVVAYVIYIGIFQVYPTGSMTSFVMWFTTFVIVRSMQCNV